MLLIVNLAANMGFIIQVQGTLIAYSARGGSLPKIQKFHYTSKL